MSSEGNIGMFIALYLAGALTRRITLRKQAKKGMLAAAGFFIFALTGSEVMIKLLAPRHFDYFVWPMTRPTVAMAACLLFCAVKGKEFRLPKTVVTCAQSTFGVYLIHIGALQEVIFNSIFSIAPHFGKAGFPVILVTYGAMLYLLCVLADRIRFYALERHYQPAVSKASEWAEVRIKGMLQQISAALE